jgi:predicted RND superfamily exporter protein
MLARILSLVTVIFFDSNGQPKIFLGAIAVSGIMLSFVSIIILIAGGIILLIDRRRAKRMKPKE